MASGGATKFNAVAALLEKGELSAAMALVSNCPATATWRDAGRRSLLMRAIEFKQERCAMALIPLSWVEMAGPEGRTALMMAASLGLSAVVAALLPDGDPSAVDEAGMTALMHAAKHGQAESAKLLLALGRPLALSAIGLGALIYAIEGGHAECVRILLPVSDASKSTKDGMSPLGLAARRQSAEVLSLMLAHCHAKAPGDNRWTALMWAAWAGIANNVKILGRVRNVFSITKPHSPRQGSGEPGRMAARPPPSWQTPAAPSKWVVGFSAGHSGPGT